MAQSIRVVPKKKRGRPKTTGRGTLVGVRLHRSELTRLDEWATHQQDHPSRPKALWRLAELSLAAGAKTRTERGQYRFVVKESAGGKLFIAAEPAGDTIERLGLLCFDLEPGTSMTEAREIARRLNYLVTSISVTSL
jgi:hypothetical protein